MKVHFGGRLFLATATLGAVALMATGFFAALAIRSALADPGGPVPNPGHAWTQLQDHGVSGSDYWLGTTDNNALELHVNAARSLRLEPNATSPNVIGGYSGNDVTDGAYGAAICGGGESAATNRVTDNYGTIGGGSNNVAGVDDANTINQTYATVGGGQSNIASGGNATIGGGAYNTASGNTATIGGGYSNQANQDFATVGGGSGNEASGSNATVGGGQNNTASGGNATIGGGQNNTASADYSTVAGGANNTASTQWWATVGGGFNNDANGKSATVGGGDSNTASGYESTVPGGRNNTAGGAHSFAAGYRAKANNQGCFVWGDSTAADVACNTNDRFIARASGGVYLYTSSDLSTGAYLASGSGSWSVLSDRNLKDNFTPVDGQEVLASLAEIPIATWNYQPQDDSIRHMGPAAQDFSAAFGLGESETAISTVDADGVALAAIQGLYELSQEQAARIDALEARVAALESGVPLERGSESLLSSVMPFGPLFLAGLVVGALVLVQRRRARD